METIVYNINLNQEQINTITTILKEQYETFRNKHIVGVLIKKLPKADVLPVNKPPGTKGKTTHLAFTTRSRYFFVDYLGASYIDSNINDETNFKLPVKVENKYSNNSTENEFIDTYTYIWRSIKSQDNQIGISLTEKDDNAFHRFREDMYVDDFLIFVKCVNSKIKADYVKDLYSVIIKPKKADFYQTLSEIYHGTQLRLYEEENLFGNMELNEEKSNIDIDSIFPLPKLKGENIIYYGVPGTGKSYDIDQKYQTNLFRTTFYEDYSYSDFIGQVAPVLRGNDTKTQKLVYEFVPGDFAKVLKFSIDNPTKMVNFVIEELNRANTGAVFGDVFQLLDRKNFISEYAINNEQLAKYIYSDTTKDFIYRWLKIDISKFEIKIPNNLNIIATMNTSDQNIYPLDTAFTRRWQMEYVSVDFNKLENDFNVEGLDIPWREFAEYVNHKILSHNIINSEDKQIGPFFASRETISDRSKFANKVLVYLWKDVFKHNKEDLFNTDIILGIQSLIQTYNKNPYDVFNDEFKSRFLEITSDLND